MQSIDALGDALAEFKGGVVLVSHDSRLLSTVCADETISRVWVVDNGTVTFYPGDWEQFRKDLVSQIKDEMDEA